MRFKEVVIFHLCAVEKIKKIHRNKIVKNITIYTYNTIYPNQQ